MLYSRGTLLQSRESIKEEPVVCVDKANSPVYGCGYDIYKWEAR